jgi:hypothetical protein
MYASCRACAYFNDGPELTRRLTILNTSIHSSSKPPRRRACLPSLPSLLTAVLAASGFVSARSHFGSGAPASDNGGLGGFSFVETWQCRTLLFVSVHFMTACRSAAKVVGSLRFHWLSVPGKSYDAFVSCSSARPAVLENHSETAAPRPIWAKEMVPTSTVHADASMTAYGTTLSLGSHLTGTRGWYETHGFWEGSHREVAHITMIELTTVRLALREFLNQLRAEGERDHSIAYRQSGGDVDSESMGVEGSGIDGRVTMDSPPLSTPWFDFRYSPPPLSSESLRRPPLTAETRGILPADPGRSRRPLVGGRQRARLKLDGDMSS